MRVGPMAASLLLLSSGALSAEGTAPGGSHGTGSPEPEWVLSGEGVTSILFYEHLLGDLGLEVRRPTATEPGERAGALGYGVRGDSELRLAGPRSSFQSFRGGRLHHDGGFDLAWPAGRVRLQRFELRPAAPPRTFELAGPGGPPMLFLDSPHPRLLPRSGEYGFFNMDVRIAEALAAALGLPEAAGIAVGVADVRLALGPGELGSEAAGVTCTPSPTGDVDVEMHVISAVDAIHHDSDRVAAAPSVGLRNVGLADVDWYRPILPDGGGDPALVGPHPFLVTSLYRLADGAFHQIGRSDAKHAFFSANTDCPCSPAQILYVGCTDVYGTSTNANRTNLSPRDEIEAATGQWESLGSHFDGQPVDDFRDHDGSPVDHPDPFEHRLVASVSDLETPGARYFVEAWYITPGDVDIFNSMGFREVTPTFTAGESVELWTFPFVDVSVSGGPALDAWVDRAAPGANESATVVDVAGARVELAARSTLLPSGLYRYDYALLNLDLDRRLRSLSIPLPAGITVVEPTFRDGDGDAANDWGVTVGPSDILWQTAPGDPSSNALDWGTLFNFSFTANAAPAARDATLGILDAGSPSDVLASARAPDDPLLPIAVLDVVRSGSGSGGVTSSPPGVDCGSECQRVFGDGVQVTLAAAAEPLSKFARWREGGAEVGVAEQYVALMDRDRTLEAVFDSCALTLPAQQVSTAALFESCGWLVTAAGFDVVGTGVATLRAATWVGLGDGFSLQAGGELAIEIDPSLLD